MKINVCRAESDKARDCFKIGQEVSELRCSLQGAIHELSGNDRSWAKTYLYDAAAHAKELSLIYPDKYAGAILRGIRKVTKEVDKTGVSKIEKLKKGIAELRDASQLLRARAKDHCGVPLPFQEKRKIRRS